MKKRTVKSFDIKTLETKEEIITEIQKLETIKRKKGKRLAKAEDSCTCAVVLGLTTTFISVLISVATAITLIGYNNEVNNTANIISSMVEFDKIQQQDVNELTEKYNAAQITKKEFDKQCKNLNSKEYIRSVAPEFCEQETIDLYESKAEGVEKSKNLLMTSGAILVAGGATSMIGFETYRKMENNYRQLHTNTQEQLDALYTKKEELENLEA